MISFNESIFFKNQVYVPIILLVAVKFTEAPSQTIAFKGVKLTNGLLLTVTTTGILLEAHPKISCMDTLYVPD